MIKIKAKTLENGKIDFTLLLRGKHSTIASEAAYIVLRLPEQLIEESPELFSDFQQCVKASVERLKDEIKEEADRESNEIDE